MKRQKLKEFLSCFSLLVEIEIRTEKNLIEAEYIGNLLTLNIDKYGDMTVRDVLPLDNRLLIYLEDK